MSSLRATTSWRRGGRSVTMSGSASSAAGGGSKWKRRTAPANPILAIVDQPLDWAIVDSGCRASGHCRHVGTAADGPWTVKLTVPAGSAMPTSVGADAAIRQSARAGGRRFCRRTCTACSQMPRSRSTRQRPRRARPPRLTFSTTSSGVAAWSRRATSAGFELVYEAHNGALDLFGYELTRPGTAMCGSKTGRQQPQESARSCPSEWDFASTPSGEPGDTQWIGGPLTVGRYSDDARPAADGQETEHTISAPAYIVPAGIVGGPELESLWIVGSDGEELFHYDEPSPDTGVPPPPPPSPGC